MGKMFNALVLSGMISIVLAVLDGSGIIGTIAQFFISPPSEWGTFMINAMLNALGISTTLGISAIVIGSVVIKQDWLVRLGMFSVLVSWVTSPFILLWQFLSSKIVPLESCATGYDCSVLVNGATATTLGMLVSAVIVGPLLLYALWACWSQIWSPEQ